MSAHGTRSRYVAGCRCEPCTTANRLSQRAWARARVQRAWARARVQRAYGAAPESMVDGDIVRAHLSRLAARGLGQLRVAALAGVRRRWLANMINGVPHRGYPPTKRVRADLAAKVLAVPLDAPPAAGAVVDGTGTRRRLQALVAIGWTQERLGRKLGMSASNMDSLIERDRVLARTAARVRDLYRELAGQPPPARTAAQRCAINRSRRYAAARGWASPMAWDGEEIDNPAARPDTRGARTPTRPRPASLPDAIPDGEPSAAPADM